MELTFKKRVIGDFDTYDFRVPLLPYARDLSVIRFPVIRFGVSILVLFILQKKVTQ